MSATQAGCRGCPFINYANAFPDPSDPGHRVVEANKRERRRRLTTIAEAETSCGRPFASCRRRLYGQPYPCRPEGPGCGAHGGSKSDGRRAYAKLYAGLDL
jgi:hypothetical protein